VRKIMAIMDMTDSYAEELQAIVDRILDADEAILEAAITRLADAGCENNKKCRKALERAQQHLDDAGYAIDSNDEGAYFLVRTEDGTFEDGDFDDAVAAIRKAWTAIRKDLEKLGPPSLGKGASLFAADDSLPNEFAVHPNYPNPFRARTTVQVDLPEAADVRMVMYDILGREVAVIVNGSMPAGRHLVQIDGERLSSGMYLVRTEAGAHNTTLRLVLSK